VNCQRANDERQRRDDKRGPDASAARMRALGAVYEAHRELESGWKRRLLPKTMAVPAMDDRAVAPDDRQSQESIEDR
jgi:hypothetical protein